MSIAQIATVGAESQSLLDILRALHPDEWDNFSERIADADADGGGNGKDRAGSVLTKAAGRRGSISEQTVAAAKGTLKEAKQRRDEGDDKEQQLMRWCSERGQTLSRTVRGVMTGVDALRVLARLEGVAEEEVEALVGAKFEYLVHVPDLRQAQARVVEGGRPLEGGGIDELRRQFSPHAQGRVRRGSQKEADGDAFTRACSGRWLTRDEQVLYKVKLPGNPIIGEGKPENQNHAVIFARGECLQTLDMNQDNYMGEAFKMRNLLEGFRGNVASSASASTSSPSRAARSPTSRRRTSLCSAPSCSAS